MGLLLTGCSACDFVLFFSRLFSLSVSLCALFLSRCELLLFAFLCFFCLFSFFLFVSFSVLFICGSQGEADEGESQTHEVSLRRETGGVPPPVVLAGC